MKRDLQPAAQTSPPDMSLEPTAAAAATQPSVFGHLLPRQAARPTVAELVALAATMNDGMFLNDGAGAGQRGSIAAGYTYLGQVIDHDLTSDRSLPLGVAGSHGQARTNFSTPAFDLDGLYGAGPTHDAALYEADGLHLKLDGHDLVRKSDGRAVIKDPRNDSNVILSQLHAALARFHNRVADNLDLPGAATGAERFAEARALVCRHYQWIVLHDFLPKIVGQDLVTSILGANPAQAAANLKLFKPGNPPKMPFEFAAAAFRFGHSMVRSGYRLNSKGGQTLTFDRMQPDGNQANDLRGFRPVPAAMAIDWSHFFTMPDAAPTNVQFARPLDTLIALPLFELPFSVANDQSPQGRMLPLRNLHRSENDIGLPTGQELAAEMRRLGVPEAASMKILGVDTAFHIRLGELSAPGESENNLGGTGISKSELEQRLGTKTPLWYYILKEAADFQGGQRLGPVGGRIVAEVIIGLLLAVPDSVLQSQVAWRPQQGNFGCRVDSLYGIANLLDFAATV